MSTRAEQAIEALCENDRQLMARMVLAGWRFTCRENPLVWRWKVSEPAQPALPGIYSTLLSALDNNRRRFDALERERA